METPSEKPEGKASDDRTVVDYIHSAMKSVDTDADILTVVPRDVLAKNHTAALRLLGTYEIHRNPEVRFHALLLDMAIAAELAPDDRDTRRVVVQRLVAALDDPEPSVWQHAARWLHAFEENEFSAEDRAMIRKHLNQGDVPVQILRVVGVAGLREETERLRGLVRGRDSKRHGTRSWVARLVLARLGDKQEAETLTQEIEREQDIILRVTTLLHDLGYTRQPTALRTVKLYLTIEGHVPGSEPDVDGPSYAQYALDALAQYVPRFPVRPKYPGGYTPAEIEAARAWQPK